MRNRRADPAIFDDVLLLFDMEIIANLLEYHIVSSGFRLTVLTS
jgi:hypothetical protein